MLQYMLRVFIMLLLARGPLLAQTVPRFAVDVIGGNGLRSEQSRDTWFVLPNREGFLRLSGTIRLGAPARLRPIMVVAYHIGPRGDEIGLCAPAPNGSCLQYFSETSGPSVGLGIDAALTSRLSAAAIGGAAHTDVTLPFVGVRGTLGVVRRVAFVAEYRHMAWRDGAGRRVWFQPLGFGIQVR